MDVLFKERLRLSPLTRMVLAILHVSPRIGLVVRGQPGPLRDGFMAELVRSPQWASAKRLAQRDVRAFATRRSNLLALAGPGDGPRENDDEADSDDRRPLILSGADRYSAVEAAHLVTELGETGPVIAFDEGTGEETLPDALADRLGIWLDLSAPEASEDIVDLGLDDELFYLPKPADPLSITASETAISTLCEAAAAFAIPSLRAPLLALSVARASAALAGRILIDDEDVLLACRLVLAPRARQAPSFDESREEDEPNERPEASNDDEPPSDEHPPEEPDQPDTDPNDGDEDETDAAPDGDQDSQVQAEDVAIPLDLLKQLATMVNAGRLAGRTARKGAAAKAGGERGRPVGSRAGDPRHGPLDISGTLTAALPWQTFRKTRFARMADRPVILTPGDIRIRRLQAKRETATIFVVDASGSAALGRLAEAKGAVERILAECYKRRDRVAMVAFRGTGAETLLPETKSLTRARRALAALHAGGGTPLASGIRMAADLARQSERQERTPLVVFLTDGKANIGLDGLAGRANAKEHVRTEAALVKRDGIASLVIDLSLRPGQPARDLADELGGRYLALPNGDASSLAKAVASDQTKVRHP